jgi:hypothetical protein
VRRFCLGLAALGAALSSLALAVDGSYTAAGVYLCAAALLALVDVLVRDT